MFVFVFVFRFRFRSRSFTFTCFVHVFVHVRLRVSSTFSSTFVFVYVFRSRFRSRSCIFLFCVSLAFVFCVFGFPLRVLPGGCVALVFLFPVGRLEPLWGLLVFCVAFVVPCAGPLFISGPFGPVVRVLLFRRGY